jgi:hypothetical protein
MKVIRDSINSAFDVYDLSKFFAWVHLVIRIGAIALELYAQARPSQQPSR